MCFYFISEFYFACLLIIQCCNTIRKHYRICISCWHPVYSLIRAHKASSFEKHVLYFVWVLFKIYLLHQKLYIGNCVCPVDQYILHAKLFPLSILKHILRLLNGKNVQYIRFFLSIEQPSCSLSSVRTLIEQTSGHGPIQLCKFRSCTIVEGGNPVSTYI